MFQIPSASDSVTYKAFPAIMIIKPVEKEAVLQLAYHTSLIKQQRKQEKEVEKICDWFIGEFMPLRVELIWHKARLERIRDMKIPSLYEIQLKHYHRYIGAMNLQPAKLSKQGQTTSSTWCGYSGYMS